MVGREAKWHLSANVFSDPEWKILGEGWGWRSWILKSPQPKAGSKCLTLNVAFSFQLSQARLTVQASRSYSQEITAVCQGLGGHLTGWNEGYRLISRS